jgi:hypothetical protein
MINVEQWKAFLISVGIPGILAIQLYMVFVVLDPNTDKLFCEYLDDHYPSQFEELMQNEPDVKATCCSFERFSSKDVCK